MMPTQIIELDLDRPAEAIRVRDDVGAVFVVALRAGRPVHLLRIPRPSSGILTRQHIAGAGCCTREAHPAGRAGSSACLSVVIPTHERPDDLSRCLNSLSRLGPSHEVIVVDNAPATTATRSVAHHFGVRLVTEPRQGLDHARNAGVAAARHAIVAFVDDDVVVSPTWAAAVAASFDQPAVACVTGLVLPLELETEAQESFENYSHQRRDLTPRQYSRTTIPPSTAGVVGIGANMALRRDVVLALGGFDPRLDAGTKTRSGGDTDMFARVIDAGHTIRYLPDAFVWHRHRRTAREVRACVFGYGVGLYSMLTKRVFEHHDLGALNTAARWWVGPVVKAAHAKFQGRPAPPWSIVLSETAGALFGPLCFGVETLRSRSKA